MALTSDIVESWHSPRRVVRRLRGAGRSEPFVFTFLFIFLLLALVCWRWCRSFTFWPPCSI